MRTSTLASLQHWQRDVPCTLPETMRTYMGIRAQEIARLFLYRVGTGPEESLGFTSTSRAMVLQSPKFYTFGLSITRVRHGMTCNLSRGPSLSSGHRTMRTPDSAGAGKVWKTLSRGHWTRKNEEEEEEEAGVEKRLRTFQPCGFSRAVKASPDPDQLSTLQHRVARTP